MTAVKKKEQLPAFDVSADIGAGFEEADKDAYAVPFLRILQALSPAVVDGLEGAKPGRLFNTVTEECFDEALFVPCHYQRRMVEWVPINKGGGFVAEHLVGAPETEGTERDGSKDVLPNGNELVDTRYHYGLLVTESGYEPTLICMSSTATRVSKRWMSLMQSLRIDTSEGKKTPPMFSQVYRLGTVQETNKDNLKYFNWSVKREGPVTDAELYDAAKAFREAVLSGQAKAKMDDFVDGEQADDAPF